MNSFRTKIIPLSIGYLATVLVLVSFLIGVWYGNSISSGNTLPLFLNPAKEVSSAENEKEQLYGEVHDKGKENLLKKDVDFDIFWEIWNYVRSNAWEQPVAEPRLFYGALAGVVASLNDPYSMFFDPQTAEMFQNELQGNFEGIGAEIGMKKDRLTIVSPLPNTPAAKSGLKAGDVILAIDGRETQGMNIDVAVSLIRGEKGTAVSLIIEREGAAEPFLVQVVRDEIQIQSLKWEIKITKNANGEELQIAHIDIIHFSDDTVSLMDTAIEEILQKKIDGIILDLRGNPGGYLEAAIEVASEWIEDGVVVKEEFPGGKNGEEYTARGRARLKEYKTVVLIDRGSASASEIVAGALQDYKLATLLGEKTFGKGTVQELETFKDGSAVKLTVAHWLTPLGRKIEHEGVSPDIAVTFSEDDRENGDDPQLEQALKAF